MFKFNVTIEGANADAVIRATRAVQHLLDTHFKWEELSVSAEVGNQETEDALMAWASKRAGGTV